MSSGVTPESLDIGVNANGLAPGVYTGNVIFESLESIADPISVPVSLIVNPDIPVSSTNWFNTYED